MKNKNEVIITEIFKSLSGEGNPIGVPTVFVRFFGCNMDPVCSWCDTMFSVKKIDDTVQKVPVEYVVNKVIEFDTEHVVFTGGEPMLYKEQIKTIMELLSLNGDYKFHFETNGIECPVSFFEDYDVTYAVSPKLHALVLKEKMHLRRDCNKYAGRLRKWGALMDKSKICFKFVYEGEETVKKIKLFKRLMMYHDAGIEYYLMPEGRVFDQKKYQECAQVCIENNWSFSPRLQCIIWNDARGT